MFDIKQSQLCDQLWKLVQQNCLETACIHDAYYELLTCLNSVALDFGLKTFVQHL